MFNLLNVNITFKTFKKHISFLKTPKPNKNNTRTYKYRNTFVSDVTVQLGTFFQITKMMEKSTFLG